MSSITHKRQKRPSLFGPIVLIAVGIFFLFNRLNPVTDLYWVDVFRLWPLFLIFVGVNILVMQAPRPYGILASGLVAILAVIIFGYILIAGLPEGILGRSSLAGWQTRAISSSIEDVDFAVLDLEIGPPGADMYALEDSVDLIAGTVSFQTGLLFDKRGTGDDVSVTLAPRNNSGWFWVPGSWNDLQDESRWQVGLSPAVPMSLNLEAVAGSSELDFRELNLSDFSLKISAGEMTVFLPDGTYDIDVETNAAETNITLPATGKQNVNLRVNAGAVYIELPEGMALRVTVDQTIGSFNSSGLVRVGDSDVWQTADYDDNPNRIDMELEISIGSVNIR